MPHLLIFNPDTDYALASDREYYTSPAHVQELQRRFAFLPALYASEGDAIMIPDDAADEVGLAAGDWLFPDLHAMAREKHLEIARVSDLAEKKEEFASFTPDPWGWNRSIRRFLLDNVGEMHGIPSEEEIKVLRELSHRRTTILMLKVMRPLLDPQIELPVEILDTQTAMDAFRKDRHRYFKAPWSSSGRGVMLADDLEERHVEPWLRGIIRRQGSVMMEKAYIRTLDFATEWHYEPGSAEFLGYSVFETSRRGKYHRNLQASQSELLSIIRSKADGWNDEYLAMQKLAIEKTLGAGYRGPLGIDMLVTDTGAVNPCVEMNLRHTMGMLNLVMKKPEIVTN